MADVRSLLKAKRQDVRISHPYAAYTPSNQLKCSICATIVKHSSAWEGHLGSKAHRTNVARLRQEEWQAVNREAERQQQEQPAPQDLPSKRKAGKSPTQERDFDAAKKRRLRAQPSSSSSLPADFFSDPGRQLPHDEDQDSDEGAMAVDDMPPAAGPSSQAGAQRTINEEYERFQKEMLESERAAAAPLEAYAGATIAAEAELLTEEQIGAFARAQEETVTPAVAEGGEEENRRKRELDERELIMDRLLEEERIQEEADMRVATMKARMEALKKKRETRRAERAQKSTAA